MYDSVGIFVHDYALVNFMPPQEGGGIQGDLTNRGVKFPTTGAKSAVKSPLCSHPHNRGFDNTSRMTKCIANSCMQLVINLSCS